jgi:hypothetical protein
MTASRVEIAVECDMEGCSGVVVLRPPALVFGVPRGYLQLHYRGTCRECGWDGVASVIGSTPEDEREQLLDGLEREGVQWIPEATCREKQKGAPLRGALPSPSRLLSAGSAGNL